MPPVVHFRLESAISCDELSILSPYFLSILSPYFPVFPKLSILSPCFLELIILSP